MSRLALRPGVGAITTPPAALLAHTLKQSADGSSNPTTTAIDTTGATLIVLAVTNYAPGGQRGVSDSKIGNVWTGLTYETTSSPAGQLFYCSNPAVGAGHTFSVTGAGTAYPSIAALAFSRAGGGADIDRGAAGGASTIQPEAATPAHASEVIVCLLSANYPAVTFSIDSAFAITDQHSSVPGGAFALGVAYLIQTAAAAVNPTWSNDLGGSPLAQACTIASFLNA